MQVICKHSDLGVVLAKATIEMLESVTDRKPNKFWNFSLRFYSQPEVADACLSLQDDSQVDVNVLLLLFWLAAAGKGLSCDEVAMIDGHVKRWRETVVAPLRAVRRSIPKSEAHSPQGEFRSHLKRLELEAEHLQQDDLFALFSTLAPGEPSRELALQNLAAYAAYLDCRFPETTISRLLSAYEALRKI